MIRGGSWNNDPQNARSAYRNNRHPTNRNDNQGFRLLRPLPESALRPQPEQAPPQRHQGSPWRPSPPARSGSGLYAALCDPEHLTRAAALTARGKRRRADVAWFLFRQHAELRRIRAELVAGTWTPQGFDRLRIRDPKPRIIARAPIEDRVVHTALVLLMEPVFLPGTLPQDMACRVGGGAHRAVIAVQRAMRQHRFALHLDVRSYFPSIDLAILRDLVGRRIRDSAFMEVIERVLASGAGLVDGPCERGFLGVSDTWPPPGQGLPVGAYTSQFLATHVYLCAMDHHIKRALKVPAYVRYVDDLFLFGDSRAELRTWRAEIGRWLWERRRLKLKHPDARVLASAGQVDALGCRVTREQISPLRRARLRLERRLRRALLEPEGPDRRVSLERSVASSVGLLLG